MAHVATPQVVAAQGRYVAAMAWKRHKQYRLPGYDYSGAGAYFITVCTKGRERWLGEVRDGKMEMLAAGVFLDTLIAGLEEKLPHLQVDEWQVMPDHVHLMITLKPTSQEMASASPILPVTPGLRPLRPKSVESFVNHLKGKVTRWCREQGDFEFSWQARFHDRIVRDFEEYKAIQRYIQNNVTAWWHLYGGSGNPT